MFDGRYWFCNGWHREFPIAIECILFRELGSVKMSKLPYLVMTRRQTPESHSPRLVGIQLDVNDRLPILRRMPNIGDATPEQSWYLPFLRD